jgi:hypothetical protein
MLFRNVSDYKPSLRRREYSPQSTTATAAQCFLAATAERLMQFLETITAYSENCRKYINTRRWEKAVCSDLEEGCGYNINRDLTTTTTELTAFFNSRTVCISPTEFYVL